MNPTQLIQMDERQLMELIWERGVFVGERSSDKFKHILYNLDGLYIEETRYAFYNMLHQFRCIQDNSVLQQYKRAQENPE